MVDFRPISLLNTSYKILSKVLVAQMRPLLQWVVGPFQSSFLPGRSTADNIIIVQEVVHSLMRKKGRKGGMVLKIDLHKAYDSVSWEFLEHVLIEFNFPSGLIRLIMYCVTSSQLSVLWNGESLPYFQPARGLRQGDPLSPYLFILVMEKLSHMIQTRVNRKRWKTVKVSQQGPNLSHLFFADDLLLFAQADMSQIGVVMDCLEEFACASGLTVSLPKSKLFISPNVNRQQARRVSEYCRIPLTENLGAYLGVPIIHGRANRSLYASIVDKVQRKMASWKRNILSRAGRLTLVQSVMCSSQCILCKLPSYQCLYAGSWIVLIETFFGEERKTL